MNMDKKAYEDLKKKEWISVAELAMQYWEDPDVRRVTAWREYYTEIRGLKEGFIIGVITAGAVITATVLILL